MSYTLNQIVKLIKAAAQAHAQINTVWFGTLPDLVASDKDLKYPILLFFIRDVPLQGREERFPFQLWFIDRIKIDDPTHVQEVHSDMLSISSDIVALFHDDAMYEWEVSESVQRELFADQRGTQDRTAGVIMDLELSQPFELNRCRVPKKFDGRLFGNEFSEEFE